MPGPSTVSDETKQTIRRMYEDGKKIWEIVAAAEVSQGTVYNVLEGFGIKPNRTKTKVSADTLLEQLRDTEREAQHWKDMYERERALVDTLSERMQEERTNVRKIMSLNNLSDGDRRWFLSELVTMLHGEGGSETVEGKATG